MVQVMNAIRARASMSSPKPRITSARMTMRHVALLAAGWFLFSFYALAAPIISYIQGHYATPQSSVVTVAVRFNSAQTTGNLNVVMVGWNDSTATVSSVADTSGNPYQRAVGPTVVSGALSQ